MYDQSIMNPSLYLQFMGGNQSQQEMMGQSMTQQQPTQDPMAAYRDQMRQQKMYEIMGKGIQGMGRGMQQPMPTGNTAQIMRDPNQFRMAGTQQQQMAQMLRRR